jgi:hypothetical protein
MTTDTETPAEVLIEAAPDDDAELIAAAEQAEQDATGEHVVAFGCWDADRVFLAAVPGQRRLPYTLTVPACPGCGKSHEIKAMPRPRKSADEIAISVDAPAEPEAGPTPKKSEPEVLAAIPTDWTPVADVAKALGYRNRGSFTNRLREMRQRGAAIETSRKRRGAPMFVRRVEA